MAVTADVNILLKKKVRFIIHINQLDYAFRGR